MKQYMIGKSVRFFFLFSGSVIWAGIWLTGFSVAHWLLYVPAVFFYFASITCTCQRCSSISPASLVSVPV